jgi:hypothetical protein
MQPDHEESVTDIREDGHSKGFGIPRMSFFTEELDSPGIPSGFN